MGRRRCAKAAGPAHPTPPGSLGFPWPRFLVFDGLAGCGWALYAALLGYFGGKAFEKQPWKGLVAALLIAFAIAGAVEVARWLRRKEPA